MTFPPETRVVHPKILYFGTPVVLLTTVGRDGAPNITPMSSAWALGDRLILGLGEGGQGLANLRHHPECVVNLPDPSLWPKVEALAPLTGADPVPAQKQAQFRHEKDKFGAAGLTARDSTFVRPPRIAECPIQIEARVRSLRGIEGIVTFAVIEAQALVVHAHDAVALDDTHIDPARWSPIIYSFRHYFGLAPELGRTFRADA